MSNYPEFDPDVDEFEMARMSLRTECMTHAAITEKVAIDELSTTPNKWGHVWRAHIKRFDTLSTSDAYRLICRKDANGGRSAITKSFDTDF